MSLMLLVLANAAMGQVDTACKMPKGWSDGEAFRLLADQDCTKGTICLREPVGAGGPPFTLDLVPASQVKFIVKPGRTPKPNSYGGSFAFTSTRKGTIEIALSTGAYVDLIRDGKIVPSIGHSDRCGSVRKFVHFPVEQGRYTVQIADAPEATVRISITQ